MYNKNETKREMLQLEYNNIKQEIFTLMQRCDNLIIAMYTVSISLLGLGYELNNKYFFILIMLFIIPMQGLINVRRYHMARCSTYIKRCIEPCVEDLKWERTVGKIDSKFKELYLKRNIILKFSTYIVGVGTIIIALIAMASYIVKTIKISKEYICYPKLDILGVFIMLVLFIVISFLIKDYIDYEKISKSYDKIFDELEDKKSE